MKSLVSSLLLVSGLAQAATGLTPGSYTYLTWPGSSPVRTSEDYTVTVTSDPGPISNVFWSNQFSIGSFGGYTGMQSTQTTQNGLSGDLFLFSVWGATQSKVGSTGSWCISNTDGSTGQSCRYLYNWQVNHTYQFHLSADGNNWYSVTVSDVTNKSKPTSLFKIGSIYIPNSANNVMPGLWIQWTEYFEWNNARTVCEDAPYSSTIFGASSGSIEPTVTGTSTSSTCQTDTKITYQNNSSISTQTNGLGNSPRLTIQSGGLCLNASGGLGDGVPAILYPCSNVINELFVYASDNTIRSQSNYCLTLLDTNSVVFQTCAGLPTQEWLVQDGQIISSYSNEYLSGNATNQVVTSTTPTLFYWVVPNQLPS